MSAYEFLVFAAGAAAVWLLCVWQSKHEQRHADAVGSVCDACMGWCPQGERLCESCGRIARAKQIKESGDE